jgi:hypothetical protein
MASSAAAKESQFKNDAGQPVTKCRRSHGWRVFAYIKDGKVSGRGFVDGSLP